MHYEGTGVYGYPTDTITGGDAQSGYSGDSVVISGIDGSILYQGTLFGSVPDYRSTPPAH